MSSDPAVRYLDRIDFLTPAVLPWREIARVAREYDVLSCIDGAHLIGQSKHSLPVCTLFVSTDDDPAPTRNTGQVPLDLSDDDCCDFLITNCHKWL